MITALPEVCNCSGDSALAYYNANPDCEGAPVFVEHLDIKGDLNFQNTKDENENTPRGKNICFKTASPGKSSLQIDMEIGCSLSYEGNDLIVQMTECGDPVPKDWLFLTRCILDTNAFGYRGCFNALSFSNNNPASGNATSSVTLKPAPACSSCKCPVRLVKVDVAGEIVEVASAAVAGFRQLSTLLAPSRIDSLASMQVALSNTVAERVNIEMDQILACCTAVGKSHDNISDDFRFLADTDIVKTAQLTQRVPNKRTTRLYTEVDRVRLNDYLSVLISESRKIMAA